MQLNELLDTQELNRLVDGKYISRVECPYGPYVLYNYTERATYERIWTPETRACRGLIVDTTDGTIAARPFDKFYNIDEQSSPESALAALGERPGPIEVTEKLDGSLIIAWYDWHCTRWRCSTRGSFTSKQSYDAAAWLYGNVDTEQWPKHVTYLCEWTAPWNRIVLRYDTPSLRLIGARTADGLDAPLDHLAFIGLSIGLAVVQGADVTDLDALRVSALSTVGVEGWVVRWPDGFRVKVKTEEYTRLHRIISFFGPERVREMLLANTLNTYIASLPDEFQDEAKAIAERIVADAQTRAAALAATFQRLAPLLQESRKTFALAVQREASDDRAYLFALADGRSITDRIIASLPLAQPCGCIETGMSESGAPNDTP